MKEIIERIKLEIEEEGIQIDPPISQEEIEEFEKQYNIL